MDPKRISTGVLGLDPLLNGGYIKGRIYLHTGEAGTGKTIACLQFLVNALRLGERAVYVASTSVRRIRIRPNPSTGTSNVISGEKSRGLDASAFRRSRRRRKRP
jgi:RecA/RadA recombinase